MKYLKIFLIAISFSLSATALSARSWWNDSVIYEVFVRSFYDSDGDGIGDIKGLIQKLDYINDGNPETTTDLGADIIWLMPIFATGTYHGYDTEDYYKINPEYGTMEDFELLIDEANKRSIKIVVDLVLNHTSREHPWFIKSEQKEDKYKNYYIWSDEQAEGWGTPWGGGHPSSVWHHSETRSQYYYGAFWAGMPDLNHKNPDVFEEVKKISKFWLKKGVAGFRLDAARYMLEDGPGKGQADTKTTYDWWIKYVEYIRSVNTNALLLAEVWTGNQTVSKYYLDGKGLDMCFDFDFSQSALMAVTYGSFSSWKAGIKRRQKLSAPDEFYSPFLANHDNVRAMNIVKKNFDNAKLAAVLLFTAPGTPMLYYGEEIGLFQNEGRQDENKRTPMQWSTAKNAGFTTAENAWRAPVSTETEFTVAGQDKKRKSLLNLYRKLINLRSKTPALRNGDIEFLSVKYYTKKGKLKNSTKVVAYVRRNNDKEVLVIVNGAKSQKEVFIDYVKGKRYRNLLTGCKKRFRSDKVTMKAQSFMILE